MASKSPPAKTWKREQFFEKRLKSGGPIDATLTYVLSNVAPRVTQSGALKEITLTVSVDYGFGGDREFAPPESIRPRDANELAQVANSRKETFYGLYFTAPINASNLFDIELNELLTGEAPRCGGSGENRQCAYDTGGDYQIHPLQRVAFGQTGAIAASVHKNGEEGPALASTFCGRDADTKAVQVLDSSEDGLVLRIDTDLCELPGPGNNFCGRRPTCPVRDHLLTTVTLAFGREHFADSAPIDVLTPGTKFDMDLYFRYGVPTEGVPSPSTGMSGSGPPVIPDSTGAGTGQNGSSGSGAVAGGCACTCEERRETLDRAEELKRRRDAGEEVGLENLGALTACSGVCQREYMICEMEANAARRAAKKQTPPPAKAGCDCGCAGLEAAQKRLSSLSTQSQSPHLQALREVGECMSACRADYMKCSQQ
jgi:hypothetical protein